MKRKKPVVTFDSGIVSIDNTELATDFGNTSNNSSTGYIPVLHTKPSQRT